MKANVGDIIKSTATYEEWGHAKGDLLRVINRGDGDNAVFAENLTRPYLSKRRNHSALLLDSEYNVVSRVESEPCEDPTEKKVYFLGIPIFTIREAK